jgi:hypothetical protein
MFIFTQVLYTEPGGKLDDQNHPVIGDRHILAGAAAKRLRLSGRGRFGQPQNVTAAQGY